MIRRAYTHIGVGKTGTSAIQGYFSHFTDIHAKENDFLYYRSARINNAHQLITPGYAAVDGPGWQASLEALGEEHQTAGQSQGLISSEFLCWTDAAYCRRLKRALGDSEVKVIFLIREIGELLYASFLQRVKTRPNEQARQNFDFGAFLRQYGRGFSFAAMIAPWEEVFGREQITVLDYNRLEHGDSASAFCQLLDLPRRPHTASAPATNASLTDADLELLRFVLREWKPQPKQLKEFVVRLAAARTGRTRTRLPEEHRDLVEQHFGEADRAFRDKFNVPERLIPVAKTQPPAESTPQPSA